MVNILNFFYDNIIFNFVCKQELGKNVQEYKYITDNLQSQNKTKLICTWILFHLFWVG